MPTNLENEVARRRTFAIIAHPDAGKTTLTEKLLLFGGAIQMAGAVKARGEQRRARSDWMKVERERGISVTASVMTFDYAGCTFNLLDTPGHEDFSEDTYRTLTAVDSAVMVIDAAKGIESQTRKLFEACRLRDVPIITFVNKLDREGREPLDLLSEIQETLALDVTPASWPIGMGRIFKGCFDLVNDRLVLMQRGGTQDEGIEIKGLDEAKLRAHLPEDAVKQLRHDVEMARGLLPELDVQSYREGHLSPVYFGSAVNNFGVAELLNGLTNYAPPPRPQPTLTRKVEPTEDNVTGFVFKIQANMDPKHRDRIAFVRLCSGDFKRGMKLLHVRSGKQLNLHNPVQFLAQDRELAEDAYPGDIIGVPNHGNLRIGDTLTEGETAAVHRHPLVRAGASADRAAGGPAARQAPGQGAGAAGGGRRGAGVPPADRHRLDRRRGRRAAVRDPGRPHPHRIWRAGAVRAVQPAHRALGRGRAAGGAEELPRRDPRLDRRGPQRRPGVPGAQRLASRPRAAGLSEAEVPEDQGTAALTAGGALRPSPFRHHRSKTRSSKFASAAPRRTWITGSRRGACPWPRTARTRGLLARR